MSHHSTLPSSPSLLIPDDLTLCSRPSVPVNVVTVVSVARCRVPIQVLQNRNALSCHSTLRFITELLILQRAVAVFTSAAIPVNVVTLCIYGTRRFTSKVFETSRKCRHHSTLPLRHKVADARRTIHCVRSRMIDVVLYSRCSTDVFPSRYLEQAASVVSLNVTLPSPTVADIDKPCAVFRGGCQSTSSLYSHLRHQTYSHPSV